MFSASINIGWKFTANSSYCILTVCLCWIAPYATTRAVAAASHRTSVAIIYWNIFLSRCILHMHINYTHAVCWLVQCILLLIHMAPPDHQTVTRTCADIVGINDKRTKNCADVCLYMKLTRASYMCLRFNRINNESEVDTNTHKHSDQWQQQKTNTRKSLSSTVCGLSASCNGIEYRSSEMHLLPKTTAST